MALDLGQQGLLNLQAVLEAGQAAAQIAEPALIGLDSPVVGADTLLQLLFAPGQIAGAARCCGQRADNRAARDNRDHGTASRSAPSQPSDK